MKNAKLNKATKSMGDNRLLMLLMSATTLIVSISFVLSKLWLGDILFNNKVLSRKNAVNATLDSNVKALPVLKSNFEALEKAGPQTQVILKALPVSEEFADLGRQIEAAAAAAGARLTSIANLATVGGAAPALTVVSTQAALTPFTVQMTATGSYQALKKLVENLQSDIRPLQLTQVKLTGDEPTITLQVSLTTNWQPSTVIGDNKEEIHD